MQKNRLFKISILTVILIFLFSIVAYGVNTPNVDTNGLASESFIQNDDEILVFEANEITDQTKLFDRAIKGVSDKTVRQPVATLIQDGKDISNCKIRTYTTVQKLKTKKDLKTGKTTTLYRQDSYAIASLSDVS